MSEGRQASIYINMVRNKQTQDMLDSRPPLCTVVGNDLSSATGREVGR